MAAAMYIVVEGEDPGFDIFVNGRALARNEDSIEKMAIRLKVKPLIDFISADENLLAVLPEGRLTEGTKRPLLPPQWYSGDEGLDTVMALLDALDEEPQQLGTDGEQVLGELQEFAVVLRKTAERGARWHLAVSFI